MSKYVFSFFLLLTATIAFGQKKSIVNLIKSQSSTGIKLNGKDVIKVYQGTFRQDYSTLTSDSAYFYIQDNLVDAYGHVIINQGDTLNIYSDKLNYNGNTKVAVLTDNVRLVDKDATLTTNHLNYNTATRIGTYTDGGKLLNKDNTMLSKNGYYFAYSRDAYFRYNVSLTTPDALVKTDTMRYNTKTKISYFYGPTNIYSVPKKAEKDSARDTLYTENGDYNTVTEQAAFGKNNLYHSGTKSLKGDSLFYDKLKGYGRAVKHVTFDDKEQKVTIKGDLGTYFKEKELTVVTQDPYVIMVTEQKDTTKADSAAKADSLAKKPPGQKKNAINMAQLIKNTIPAKIDTVVDLRANRLKADSAVKKQPVQNKIVETKTSAGAALKKQPAKPPGGKHAAVAAKKPPGALKDTAAVKPVKKDSVTAKPAPKDTSHTRIDSIYMSADTIETQILTYKDLKAFMEQQRLAHVRDTSAKARQANVKESKFLVGHYLRIKTDTTYRQRDFFGKRVIIKKKPKPPTRQQLQRDSIARKRLADSIMIAKKAEPNDTARIRIIIAHHHFKMFKSDMQAKADSMFYANSDSTIRCFDKPMMWTEGSQLSGDTIYLQMKHKKLDNMKMFPNAFIVNIEKGDSVHFNQVGGRRMRGYFKNDKLNRMYIEGNAESIYFSRDSGKTTVNGMQRSLSSRIRVDFKDNKATNLGFYTKPENVYGPLDKFKEDDKVLKGFVWKPKDRPVSKESIIPSYNKKKTPEIKPPAKSSAGKAGLKKSNGKKKGKNQVAPSPAGKLLPGLKTTRDSSIKTDTGKMNNIKTGSDSTLKNKGASPLKTPKDSAMKKLPVPPAALKAKKDSLHVE